MESTLKRLTLLFFLLITTPCLLLGAGNEPGKADAALTLKTGGGTVDVLRPDGSLIQSLPYDGSAEEPDEDNRNFFAIAEDMDFDGHPDVRVLFSRGAQNIYYDGWLCNSGTVCLLKT